MPDVSHKPVYVCSHYRCVCVVIIRKSRNTWRRFLVVKISVIKPLHRYPQHVQWLSLKLARTASLIKCVITSLFNVHSNLFPQNKPCRFGPEFMLPFAVYHLTRVVLPFTWPVLRSLHTFLYLNIMFKLPIISLPFLDFWCQNYSRPRL